MELVHGPFNVAPILEGASNIIGQGFRCGHESLTLLRVEGVGMPLQALLVPLEPCPPLCLLSVVPVWSWGRLVELCPPWLCLFWFRTGSTFGVRDGYRIPVVRLFPWRKHVCCLVCFCLSCLVYIGPIFDLPVATLAKSEVGLQLYT